MRLYLPLAGVFLIVVAAGQEQNCNIDSDLIKFEDKDLEAVMKSLYSSGNCSAVVWKQEVVNVLKKHKKEIVAMSTRDKSMLRYLISFVVKPEAERPPPDYFLYLGTLTESEIMNPLDFGPTSESPTETEVDTVSPILFKFGSDSITESSTSATGSKRRKRQLQRSIRNARPSYTVRSQGLEPRTGSFNDEFEISSTSGGNVPNRHVGVDETSHYRTPDTRNVFGKEMQRNLLDQSSLDRRRRNAFMRPSFHQQPESYDFWADPQRRPTHEYRPRDPYNRPRPQESPDYSFFRPPVGDFTPDNKRKPPVLDEGFVRPIRPQLKDPDIIFMPDDQRLVGNFAGENSVFGSTSAVTTETPPRTTPRQRQGPPPWATPPSLCVRNCARTPEFNPVCGSDGVTYTNTGRLRCEQQCGKATVRINYYGTCISTTTDFTTSTFLTTPSPRPSRSRGQRNI